MGKSKLLQTIRRLRLHSISQSHWLYAQNPSFQSLLGSKKYLNFSTRFSLLSNVHSNQFSGYTSSRCFSYDSTSGEPIESDKYLSGSSETHPELLNPALDAPEVVKDEGLLHTPVCVVTHLLDGAHDLTSLPWWVIIATTTLTLRLALLPLLILQQRKLKLVAQLFPKLPPPFPSILSTKSFRDQYLLFQKRRKELGCPSPLWSFASLFVQIPCFLLLMTTIRRMSLDCHPGFDCGGTLWFQNLTELPHGTFAPIFPVLIAALHYTNIQLSFPKTKAGNFPGVFAVLAKYYKLYLDILTIPLLFIGFCIPQGSLVYWCTNSSLSTIQILTLRNTYVLKKLGLEKIHTPAQQSNPSTQPVETINAEDLSHDQLLDLSVQLVAKGQVDATFPLLRLALEKNPDSAKALVGLGRVMSSRGSPVEASDYFLRAIDRIKEEESNLLILASLGAGTALMTQGKLSEGIEQLRRISQMDEPEDPLNKHWYYHGLVALGCALSQEGQFNEAMQLLRLAAAYDPSVNIYLQQCEKASEATQCDTQQDCDAK